tara:strand:- start:3936 stop:4172 length:237 start_codon:yes stop_codon:yes gene_type:complete
MKEGPGKLIFLADILSSKERKEKELEFYAKEMQKLQDKMYWLRRDIDLTNTIITMIETENIIDFKEHMEKRLLDDSQH